jgi:hypothetical protein
MRNCRQPVNRLVMMRKRGVSGPLVQNVGGGMCAKSVGSYLDANGPGYSTPPGIHNVVHDGDNVIHGLDNVIYTQE